MLVDLSATADPFSLLDGEDADLGLVAEALFDPATGRLAPELDELVEPAGERLLILGPARLAPKWRGFGLGVLLAGVAVGKPSGSARFAACYPAPLGEAGEAGGEEDEDPAGHSVAVATPGDVWGRLGFEHFRGGVHVLDLNLVTLDESLERLRKRVGQLRNGG